MKVPFALLTLALFGSQAAFAEDAACVRPSKKAIDALDDRLAHEVSEHLTDTLSKKFKHPYKAIVRADLNRAPDGDCSIEIQGALWRGVAAVTLYLRGLTEANVAEKADELATLILIDLEQKLRQADESRESTLGLALAGTPSTRPRLTDGFGVSAGTGSRSYLSLWVQLPGLRKDRSGSDDEGAIEGSGEWLQIQFSAGTLFPSSATLGNATSTAPDRTTATQVSVSLYTRRKINRAGGAAFTSADRPEVQMKYNIIRFFTVTGSLIWDRTKDAREFSKMVSIEAARWTGGDSFMIGSARLETIVGLSIGWQARKEARYFIGGEAKARLIFKKGFFLDLDMDVQREYATGDKSDPSVTDFTFAAGRQFKGGWVAEAGMTFSDFKTSQKDDRIDICPQCGSYETYEGINLRPEGWSTGLTILKRF